MELARNEKKIGSSLEAYVKIALTPEQKALFNNARAEEVFICSQVTSMPSGDVGVEVATGKKCERCWQVLPEVGSHPDHPDLCNRCHDAVIYLRKAAA